jgi:hypothetical protein
MTWKCVEMTLNDGDMTRYIDTGNERSKYSADDMTNETKQGLNIKLPSAGLVLWV